ncbi:MULTISPECIES: methionyl-tRNA formyltransferase [unclassified Arthrobacter]|uniref:methionyl-tRNA formyltransferase n=1 Tax=unclassified Arthrobacter TaxID=235627 RepID=UPI0014914B1A|nr:MULTISPECIES: methionyl-tRNA formyltransferase [unclassified Arthrobacter]MBE0009847.1 methionyl-tRNA formyltransferase [Arthrobacter sp. AET 35A]NOJ63653.1 methionyl-tRNA formyltransferase [Arthrobacter sp. 147(2020)]
MRVLFAGTPGVAVPSLDALVDAGFDVVGVLTREDAPLGRKRILTPSPVAARAADLGLPVIRANRIDDAVTEQISALDTDVAAIVAYGGLVPQPALDVPVHGWINLHFSLLPAWRGAAPVQHAVMAGDEITGASTFRLEAGLDTGPVFGTMTEAVRPSDTSGELLERLAHSGAVLLVQTLSAVATGRADAVPQQGEVSLAPKLTIDDARVDWTQPALAVRRRINGVTPEPGAWTQFGDQRVKIGPVSPWTPDPELPPAAVVDLAPGEVAMDGTSVLVGTGSSAVVLGEVQPAGKKMMRAQDWARGALQQGELVFS